MVKQHSSKMLILVQIHKRIYYYLIPTGSLARVCGPTHRAPCGRDPTARVLRSWGGMVRRAGERIKSPMSPYHKTIS